jgi:hypothetical protein
MASRCASRTVAPSLAQPFGSTRSHAVRRWSGSGAGRVPQLQQRRDGATCCASNRQPELADRFIASVPFLIPLMDALPYGECARRTAGPGERGRRRRRRRPGAARPASVAQCRCCVLRRAVPVHAVPIHRTRHGAPGPRLLAVQLLPARTVRRPRLPQRQAAPAAALHYDGASRARLGCCMSRPSTQAGHPLTGPSVAPERTFCMLQPRSRILAPPHTHTGS